MKNAILIAAALALATFAGAGASARRGRGGAERIRIVYQGSPANYQLYIFGGQALRCRGADLRVSRDERGDGDGPIVVECR